jgi:hypothetical protein
VPGVPRVNALYEKWAAGGLPPTAAACLAELADTLEVENEGIKTA